MNSLPLMPKNSTSSTLTAPGPRRCGPPRAHRWAPRRMCEGREVEGVLNQSAVLPGPGSTLVSCATGPPPEPAPGTTVRDPPVAPTPATPTPATPTPTTDSAPA